MTLRPFGPSVTFTASASPLTPRRMACRDASPYVICFDMSASFPSGGLGRGGRGGADVLDGGEDLVFLHDQILEAVQFDLLSGVLAEEDGVARPHVERHAIAVVVDVA